MSIQRPYDGQRSGAHSKKVYTYLASALVLLVGSGLLLSSLLHTASNAHATPPPSAVSKSWYFAEGRIGAGFSEYLTISNPDTSIDCDATVAYLPEGTVTARSHAQALKPLLVKNMTIPHSSRSTISVNQDLHVTQQQNPGLLLSAMVTVADSSMCPGIVVERPMYFSFHGVSSGSDVMGATSLSSTFYFADIASSAGSSSFVNTFLSVLNPSQTTTANLTVTYYAAGSSLGTQNISVAPGGRGTFASNNLVLPAHAIAIVSSDTPVVVERSIYRSQVQEGVVGTISSASAEVGATALSDQWLFAEGYTTPASQEDLMLSNLSITPTVVTVMLEYQNGTQQTLTLTVAGHTQKILDVNQANLHPTGVCSPSQCNPTPEVSAQVTATSASLIVERQMFFHYSHTLPHTSISLSSVGGTDVLGTMHATTSVTNFAEGYTNAGYNEWLTLQNPNATDETLSVTVNNEYGRTYTLNEPVKAKSRATVDITALVRDHLLHMGDDFRGYQVSMNVHANDSGQSFVAERPMYFHLNTGIQGGTDVIGFSGSAPIVLNGSITEFSTGLTTGGQPLGITKGPDGNVWFTEADADKIGRITPGGTVTEFNTGITPSSYPTGITTGPDGNLWFTEEYGNKIGRITPSGTITEFSTGLTASNYPYDITVGPDGNLWFTEAGSTGIIGRITTSGTITEFPIGNSIGDYPYIAAGPDGKLWFTEYSTDKIGQITTSGVVTQFSAGLSSGAKASGITAGPDGNLWFAEYGTDKIGRISTSGTITEFDAGSGSGPFTITSGPDGNLWFTEYSANKIGRITTSGVVAEFGNGITPGSELYNITVGPDNAIWFAELNTSKIGRLS